jgi:prevent-host-death family protein
MRLSIVGLRANLGDVVNRAAYGGQRVVLERRGKPIAVVVSVSDAELLDALEETGLRDAAEKKIREVRGKAKGE